MQLPLSIFKFEPHFRHKPRHSGLQTGFIGIDKKTCSLIISNKSISEPFNQTTFNSSFSSSISLSSIAGIKDLNSSSKVLLILETNSSRHKLQPCLTEN